MLREVRDKPALFLLLFFCMWRPFTTVILQNGVSTFLWCWHLFWSDRARRTCVRRVLRSCIHWHKKKYEIQNLKCSNGRFKFKIAVLWFFMFINYENTQFWRTISMQDEAHSHTSAVCDRKHWLRQRNKHGGATFCCITVIAQRRRLASHPEQKLGWFTIEP